MRIVPQSVSASYCLFPIYPLLPAPRIARLLAAPQPVTQPPATRSIRLSRIAAYLEGASARLTACYAEIDSEIEAMKQAYNIRPREIVMGEVAS